MGRENIQSVEEVVDAASRPRASRALVVGDLNLDASVGYAAEPLRQADLRDGVGLPHCARGLHPDCSIKAVR